LQGLHAKTDFGSRAPWLIRRLPIWDRVFRGSESSEAQASEAGARKLSLKLSLSFVARL
jgi:hypothetical protein